MNMVAIQAPRMTPKNQEICKCVKAASLRCAVSLRCAKPRLQAKLIPPDAKMKVAECRKRFGFVKALSVTRRSVNIYPIWEVGHGLLISFDSWRDRK